MAQKALSLFLLLLAATTTISYALNITSILEQYPNFSTFNTLLTQSGVASEINGRSSITVLAVDNTVLRGFQDLPPKVIKIVLSVHVILDYYDVPKIESIGDKSTILTTLFQTTGNAQEKQGFLNMSKTGGGKDQVVFGSTMPGSVSQANLMKSVVAKPYNLSVLQVDSLIVPSVVGAPTPAPAESDGDAPVAAGNAPPANNAQAPSTNAPPANNAQTPSTNAPATTATAPATNVPATHAPTEAASALAPAANKASPATNAKAPSTNAPQADAPVTSADAKAPSNGAPEAEAPVTNAPTANAPTADAPAVVAADAPAPSKWEVQDADTLKSGAGQVAAGAGVGVVIMGSILLGL